VSCRSSPRFGPRTAAAGFIGTTWPMTSQSNSIRTAASCCFTPAAPCFSCSFTHAATSKGRIELSVAPRVSHQAKNCAQARAWARRVFGLLMLAVKNST
jgi:hypothetical protein